MRVNSRKYIQRRNPRKNKYSKKIGGQPPENIRKQALRAGVPNAVLVQNRDGGVMGRSNPPKVIRRVGPREVLPGTETQPSTTASAPAQPAQQAQSAQSAQPPPESATATSSNLNSQRVNRTLLQMFNLDVDTIAHNIKQKLGTTNEEASNAARDLFNKMEELKKEIYEKLPNNDDSYLYTKDSGYADKSIYLKKDMYKQDDRKPSKG